MAEESFKERARQEMIKAAKQYKDICKRQTTRLG